MIVVGVRFKPAGKIYYFDPATIELKLDDGVIVETARGMEFGHVVIAPRSVDSSEVVQPLKPIIRKATAKDIRQVEKNKEREKKAFGICLAKIAKHKLPMKLIDVDYTFDMGKIIFFFTDRPARRSQDDRRYRLLRPAPVLLYVPGRFQARFHPHGQGPGHVPQSDQDFRDLRPPHVLPAL